MRNPLGARASTYVDLAVGAAGRRSARRRRRAPTPATSGAGDAPTSAADCDAAFARSSSESSRDAISSCRTMARYAAVATNATDSPTATVGQQRDPGGERAPEPHQDSLST